MVQRSGLHHVGEMQVIFLPSQMLLTMHVSTCLNPLLPVYLLFFC